MASDPISHVIDSDAFHFPGHFEVNVWEKVGLTKYMVLELIAVAFCLAVFLPLAANVRRNGYAKGRLANLLEAMLFFVRDQIAVPTIGEHDAHRFVPYLWSIFFFILFNNLMGMLPWMGSPTGALGCTGALAVCSFLVIHGSGIRQMGALHYAKSVVPHVPLLLYVIMIPIEMIAHTIRPIILAFRLFINMAAGHIVLAVLLGLIEQYGKGAMVLVVAPASVTGVTLLSLLELFVAFLQAYIFTFLTALFVGMAVHPEH
jgi:F-type H+-transporting ATPase subunit a